MKFILASSLAAVATAQLPAAPFAHSGAFAPYVSHAPRAPLPTFQATHPASAGVFGPVTGQAVQYGSLMGNAQVSYGNLLPHAAPVHVAPAVHAAPRPMYHNLAPRAAPAPEPEEPSADPHSDWDDWYDYYMYSSGYDDYADAYSPFLQTPDYMMNAAKYPNWMNKAGDYSAHLNSRAYGKWAHVADRKIGKAIRSGEGASKSMYNTRDGYRYNQMAADALSLGKDSAANWGWHGGYAMARDNAYLDLVDARNSGDREAIRDAEIAYEGANYWAVGSGLTALEPNNDDFSKYYTYGTALARGQDVRGADATLRDAEAAYRADPSKANWYEMEAASLDKKAADAAHQHSVASILPSVGKLLGGHMDVFAYFQQQAYLAEAAEIREEAAAEAFYDAHGMYPQQHRGLDSHSNTGGMGGLFGLFGR
jgi:hypothetical protein